MVAEELKQANVVPDLSTIFSEEGVDNSTQSMKNLSHSAPVVRTTASRHDYMVEGGTFDALKKGEETYFDSLNFLQSYVEALALNAKNMINNEAPNVPVLGKWVESDEYFYACEKWYFRLDKDGDRITYTSYIDMAYQDYPEGFFDFYCISVTKRDGKEIIEYQEIRHDNREGNEKGLSITLSSFYYIEGEEFYLNTTYYDRREDERDQGFAYGLKKSVVDGKTVVDFAEVAYDEVIPKYPSQAYLEEMEKRTGGGKEDNTFKPRFGVADFITGSENEGFVIRNEQPISFFIGNEIIFRAFTTEFIGINPAYLNSDYSDVIIGDGSLEIFNFGQFRFNDRYIVSFKYQGEEIPFGSSELNTIRTPFVMAPKEEFENRVDDSVKAYARTFIDIFNKGSVEVAKKLFPEEAFDGREPEDAFNLILDFLYEEKFNYLYTLEEAKALPQNFGDTVDRSDYEKNITIYDLGRIGLRLEYLSDSSLSFHTSLLHNLSGEGFRLVAGYVDVLNNVEYPMIVKEVPKVGKAGAFYDFQYDLDDLFEKFYSLPLGSYTCCVWYEKKEGDEWVRCTPLVVNEQKIIPDITKKDGEIRIITRKPRTGIATVFIEGYDIVE